MSKQEWTKSTSVPLFKGEHAKGAQLTLDDLEKVMYDHWRMCGGHTVKETSLTTFTKNSGACFECGKKGHRKEQCWNLEKNASKHPKWFKKKPKEVANVCYEIQL